MKLIVTGCTGTIGHAALISALRHPSVDTVVALSRRELPADADREPYAAKLKVVLVKDWENVDDEVKEHLRTAAGCVWSVHISPHSHFDNADVRGRAYRAAGNMASRTADYETKKRVTFGYAKALIDAIPSGRSARMKMVHIGGQIFVRDQNASLWILPGLRKAAVSQESLKARRSGLIIRAQGALQNDLLDHCAKQPDKIDMYLGQWNEISSEVLKLTFLPSADPGFVQLANGKRNILAYVAPAIDHDVIGAALVDTVINGGEPRCLTNSDMVSKGKAALQKRQAL